MKVAQAVIRLIAFGLVVTSFLLYVSDRSSYYVHALIGSDLTKDQPPPTRPGLRALQIIPLVVGLILFWKSRALAERLTKDLD
jgi:hypothetical protein